MNFCAEKNPLGTWFLGHCIPAWQQQLFCSSISLATYSLTISLPHARKPGWMDADGVALLCRGVSPEFKRDDKEPHRGGARGGGGEDGMGRTATSGRPRPRSLRIRPSATSLLDKKPVSHCPTTTTTPREGAEVCLLVRQTHRPTWGIV